LLAGFGRCLCHGDEGSAGVVAGLLGFWLLERVIGVVLQMLGLQYLFYSFNSIPFVLFIDTMLDLDIS